MAALQTVLLLIHSVALLVEMHLEGSAPAACAERLVTTFIDYFLQLQAQPQHILLEQPLFLWSIIDPFLI